MNVVRLRHRDARWAGLPLLLVAMALLLAACAGASETGTDTAADAEATEPAPAEASEPAVADAETSAPDAQAADATITAVDYAFEVDEVAAGDTVEFVNSSDAEAHEMVVMKVNDDTVTLEDIQELLEQDTEGPPPEFLEEAGFAFAMPGETAEQTVTLDAGRYLLLCFIPQNAPPDLVAEMMEAGGPPSEEPDIPSEVEAQLGPPHALAGMVDLIEVQ